MSTQDIANSATAPTLYQYNVCPFCWKIKATLHYQQIPYNVVEVHPLNKKEIKFSEEYKKVPIFVDAAGKQHNDSEKIMRALNKLYPEKSFLETETDRKKEENKWMRWADEKLVKALPPLVYQSFGDSIKAFDYITTQGKFNWIEKQTIKYSGAAIMYMVAKKSAKSQKITDPKETVATYLKEWSTALGDEDFLGQEKPNGADLAIFGVLKSTDTLPAAEVIQENKKIRSWFKRMNKLTKSTVQT